MTLVLRALEGGADASIAEFVLCHDRDETEVLLSAFEDLDVEFPDLISDPHFYLDVGRHPDKTGWVRVGHHSVTLKTARAVMNAIADVARYSRHKEVRLALVDLETIN
ncbi:MAG: hypothetical protein DI537_05250 [Stutzerimonas stutzeri]|nr:MAG: hypothetical protein DI537_05250 [Stutzerimonas stutzeri]